MECIICSRIRVICRIDAGVLFYIRFTYTNEKHKIHLKNSQTISNGKAIVSVCFCIRSLNVEPIHIMCATPFVRFLFTYTFSFPWHSHTLEITSFRFIFLSIAVANPRQIWQHKWFAYLVPKSFVCCSLFEFVYRSYRQDIRARCLLIEPFIRIG